MRYDKTGRAFATASFVLAIADAAAAHPGHGLGGGSATWLHYLTEPLHVAPLALGALTLALGWRRWREARAHTR